MRFYDRDKEQQELLRIRMKKRGWRDWTVKK